MTPAVEVTVDVVVLTLPLEVADPERMGAVPQDPPPAPLMLAVRRDRTPFAGAWSLPGGHVGRGEELEAAARRVLAEAGDPGGAEGASGPEPSGALGHRLAAPRHLEQLATFGAPDRDPRGRVLSVSYLALLPRPSPVAERACWHPALDPPPLAFDHGRILAAGVRRLRSKLAYSTVAYGLLPDAFTLSELQAVYEAVLGRTMDKRNFRKKVRSLGLLVETAGVRRGPHRPAQLYRFGSPTLVLLDDPIVTY